MPDDWGYPTVADWDSAMNRMVLNGPVQPKDDDKQVWTNRQVFGWTNQQVLALSQLHGPILVLACDHRQYMDWCHIQGLRHTDTTRVRYVHSPQQLRGYGSVGIVKLPGWDTHWTASERADAQAYIEYIEKEQGMKATVVPDFRQLSVDVTDAVTVDRVPLSVDVTTGFAIAGRPGTRRDTQYLDGGYVQESFTTRDHSNYFATETDMPDAVSSRTSNIADFGRIKIAASKLAGQMASYNAASPPSPEQLAVFIRSYQNMVRWRTAVEAQMEMANGQMSTIEGMLDRWLD